MRLISLAIENFRSFKTETISFNDYTCLVGPNGAGKSTVLTALNLFFRETDGVTTNLATLQEEDFHNRDTSTPIKITLTFDSLSPEAQTDFAGYFRQDKLIVCAKAHWNANTRTAEVKHYGQRMVFAAFSPFFKAHNDGALVTPLRVLYGGLRQQFKDLPDEKSKDGMREALSTYEASHPQECSLMESEDQFYGATKGQNKFQKYIQWVYVPAVKDAATEQFESKNALSKLLARTVRSRVTFDKQLVDIRKEAMTKYSALLDEKKDVLEEISKSLTGRIQEWAQPDITIALQWQELEGAIKVADPLAMIKAGDSRFEGQLSRFGHGLQRCYILALLQELSQYGTSEFPKLLLGCEEPELYQHPPQASHIANVLATLSKKNSQVLVSTHSPHFISGRGFEDIRIVRKGTQTIDSRVKQLTYDQVSTSIAAAKGDRHTKKSERFLLLEQVLQPSLNEIFFSPTLILVEGLEDVAYITAYLQLKNLWADFRKYGCHIVAAGGKSSMIEPIAILNGFEIPTFVVLDSDGDKPDKSGSREKHRKDNTAILKLCGIANPDSFPVTTLWSERVTMWKSEIGNIVEEEIGAQEWRLIKDAVRQSEDLSICDLAKKSVFIGLSVEKAFNEGKLIPSLDRLCSTILSFAEMNYRTRGLKVVAEAISSPPRITA